MLERWLPAAADAAPAIPAARAGRAAS